MDYSFKNSSVAQAKPGHPALAGPAVLRGLRTKVLAFAESVCISNGWSCVTLYSVRVLLIYSIARLVGVRLTHSASVVVTRTCRFGFHGVELPARKTTCQSVERRVGTRPRSHTGQFLYSPK